MEILTRKIKRNKIKNWKKQKEYPRPNKIGQYWRNMQIKLKGEIPFLIEYNKTNKILMSNQDIFIIGIKEVKSKSYKNSNPMRNHGTFKKRS